MSDVALILQRLGRTLVTDVAPALEGHYAGGHASMAGLLAVMAGEAWDGAADRLVREIEGMQAILRAAGQPGDTTAKSYRVSDLMAVRDRLAEQIIALQTEVEARDDETSRTLNAQIWGLLLGSAAERMPSPPDFATPDDPAESAFGPSSVR